MKKLIFIIAGIFISFTGVSQSCLPTGIDFNNQAAIDNFQVMFPGCTEIEGNVEISGDGILNLNGLSVLTSIGGFLYITSNDSLINLSGLSSLASVGGSLLISSNPSLTSLNGLESLSTLDGDVFISTNTVLNDISALGNLDAETVMELRISGNTSLTTCDNAFICSYLSNPNDKVNIHSNAPGCNNPPEIADDCGITLSCLPFGNYTLSTQVRIDNFQFDYPGCTELAGVVKISGTDITSMEGLNMVTSINGSLEVHNNPELTSLAGLDSINIINGPLTIVGNSLLTNIEALGAIDTSGLTFLAINNNPLLSSCAIESICDYLFGPFGSTHYNIVGNNDGCKDLDEVLFACTVGLDDIKDEEGHLKISPNPAYTHITIETHEAESQFPAGTTNTVQSGGLISIFNLNGQEMIKQPVVEPVTVIDISKLSSGVYFVRLEGEKDIRVRKFVKLD